MPDNGFVALVFIIWSSFGTEWSAPLLESQGPRALAVSMGQTYRDGQTQSHEVRLSYVTGRRFGVWDVVLDGSFTDHGGAFAGAGLRIHEDFTVYGQPAFASASIVTGMWRGGDDVDLGFALNFRSDVELGLIFGASRLGLVWDHRSHGYVGNLFDADASNPGLESLSLRYSQEF